MSLAPETKANFIFYIKHLRPVRNQTATKRNHGGMIWIQAEGRFDATGTDICKRKWAGNRNSAPGFSGSASRQSRSSAPARWPAAR
ncbi:hypothetical protein MPLA_200024 [Mesorhizobium sp. ORS 3359]|nr:hypothetical protein MPLA_200024 [Mesorhizobium sp. ORS 3359]